MNIKELVTTKDNNTLDIGRISWIVCLGAILFIAGFEVYQLKDVNIRELAESLGLVSGAHSASLWAKKDTEPDVPPTN